MQVLWYLYYNTYMVSNNAKPKKENTMKLELNNTEYTQIVSALITEKVQINERMKLFEGSQESKTIYEKLELSVNGIDNILDKLNNAFLSNSLGV